MAAYVYAWSSFVFWPAAVVCGALTLVGIAKLGVVGDLLFDLMEIVTSIFKDN